MDETDVARKRADEIRLVSEMVSLYCRGHRHASKAPCPDCAELIDYCTTRINRCPREKEKTFCSACPHPCYRPDMRERIREVMRWSGPRMLFVHPTIAVRHLAESPPWQRRRREASPRTRP